MTDRSSDAYVYRPLPEGSIRLIELSPGAGPAELRCRLVGAPLAHLPEFVALSYTWGEPVFGERLAVDDRVLYITDNLKHALLKLRYHGWLRVWADAVCINQQDVPERSRQVSLMKDLYEAADRVVVWLGARSDAEDDEDDIDSDLVDRVSSAGMSISTYRACIASLETADPPAASSPRATVRSQAMDYVRLGDGDAVGLLKLLAAHFERDPDHGLSWLQDAFDMDLYDSQWKELLVLLSSPWFHRVWVIQEFVVSRSATFMYGVRRIGWSQLRPAVQMILAGMSLPRRDPSFPTVASVAGDGLMNFVRMESMRLALSEGAVPILTALNFIRTCQCTDQRDRVYAMKNIAADARLVRPDYMQDAVRVSCGLVKALLDGAASLDILCFKTSGALDGLPSWAPDWTPLPDYTMNVRLQNLHHALTTRLHTRRVFTADRKAEATLDDGMRNLVARGFIVDAIAGLGGVFRDARLAVLQCDDERPEYLTLQSGTETSSPYGDESGTLDAIARSIARGNDSEEPLIEDFGLAFATCIEQAVRGQSAFSFYRWYAGHKTFRIQGRTLHEWASARLGPDPDQQAVPPYAQTYSGAVLRDFWFYRLATTTRGYVGTVPLRTGPGDLVCVLLGCMLPLVLRPKGDGYVLLGECYVHGIMNGEAMRHLDEGRYDLRDFMLV